MDHTTLTYSLAEAAAKIPCTERWLADGLRAGRFRGAKIMGQWRLTDEDLHAIVRSCRVEPAKEPTFADTVVRRGRKAG